MGVGGERHASAALRPGETRFPLYRRLGGPHCRSGLVRKTLPPQESDPQTVQPVASCHTDCAIPAENVTKNINYWASSFKVNQIRVTIYEYLIF
jgi:hypothetical protein